MTGRIDIIIGCMFSGKSTEMIRRINRSQVINKKSLIINSNKDTRYGNSVISTHNLEQVKCLSLSNLSELYDNSDFLDTDLIFIEEAQFFEDLYDFCVNCADNFNKHLVLCGLDGDYLRNPFGDILKLIPHAESVTKLNAYCSICNDGTIGNFTKRIISDTNQTLVGSTELYRAVCRKHYLN